MVRAYSGEARAAERFDNEQALYLGEMKRSLFIRGAFTPTLEVLGIAGVALSIAFGARAIATEPQLASKLVSFLAAALLMYQPLKALSGTFGEVMRGLAATGRLFEITDHPAPPDTGSEAGTLTRELDLRGVRFAYPNGHVALNGVDLRVPAGKRAAIVGSSGSGKTTLFSVLLGFVDAQGGEVLWDDKPLGTLSRRSVREQVGWVPQEPVLFAGTVRQNLLLGRPEATDDELWDALRRAHADAFVKSFAGALDEDVGERGSRLSGGQKQRLAIARAFLRRPSLLLLDEPTSALDAESERGVQAGLRELMQDRTTLVIAHRLATVRAADRIVVMDEGRIVEQGTHAQLAEAGGLYSRLAALQFAPSEAA